MKTQRILTAAAAATTAITNHEVFSKQTISDHLQLKFPGHEAAVRGMILYYDYIRLHSTGSDKAKFDGCPALTDPGTIALLSIDGLRRSNWTDPDAIHTAVSMDQVDSVLFTYLIGKQGRCGTFSVDIGSEEWEAPVYQPPSGIRTRTDYSDAISIDRLRITPQEALDIAVAKHGKYMSDGFYSMSLSPAAKDAVEPTYDFFTPNATVSVGATNGLVDLVRYDIMPMDGLFMHSAMVGNQTEVEKEDKLYL